MDGNKKTCCFFGHRKIEKRDTLKRRLYEIIENLIVNENTDTFLFGSKSEFDSLCCEVVSALKEKYTHIKRIYVRAEYPVISDDYEKYLLQSYEETYFPQKAINAGKAVYVERNCEMIDKSDFCVVYYDKNYVPPRRKNNKRDLLDYQPKSGTNVALNYAIKKGACIKNVFTQLQSKM